MSADQIDLKQAAATLGKSSRQVRRYVADGKLKASGGGHGVPYSFDTADVAAFCGKVAYRPRRTWKGRVDVNTLARIVHAVALRRIGQGKHYLLYGGFRALWNVSPKTAEGIIRNGLPPLAHVPPETMSWAKEAAGMLTAQETDYLTAMFIVRDSPGTVLTENEGRALGGAFDILKQKRPHLFRNETTLQQSPEEWAAIEESVRASLADYSAPVRNAALEMKREQFFDPSRREIAWRLYGDHNPRIRVVKDLAGAVHRGDVEEVWRLVYASEDDQAAGFLAPYPEADRLRKSLVGLVDKIRLLHRHRNRAPTSRQVAQVLGLHHQQGTRLAESIMHKLSIDRIVDLWCNRLGLDEVELRSSRLWQRVMKTVAQRSAGVSV